jgi:hypothetical protein
MVGAFSDDRSVVYNCCWPSSAQSFSGPSPVGLMTIFYCLRYETSPTWRARSPYILQEESVPVVPPGTGFPFRRLLRLSGLRWRYSNPPPHELPQSPQRLRARVTSRLAVQRQLLRLGANPSRLTTRDFVLQLNHCGRSPYVISPRRSKYSSLLFL